MISQAGQWTQIPSATPLQPKNEMLIFGLHSTSDDWPSWSMDWNPLCHTSPAKNMKCFFLDYVEPLMISRACQWTWTPSTTCLQPKKLNAHILIMFNFWCWPDWSMDSNPIHHPSPAIKNEVLIFELCSLLMMICLADWWTWTSSATPLHPWKNEMLNFWLRSTSDDQPSWSIDSKSICQPSPAKKMKCSFFDYVQLLMISWAGQWT